MLKEILEDTIFGAIFKYFIGITCCLSSFAYLYLCYFDNYSNYEGYECCEAIKAESLNTENPIEYFDEDEYTMNIFCEGTNIRCIEFYAIIGYCCPN